MTEREQIIEMINNMPEKDVELIIPLLQYLSSTEEVDDELVEKMLQDAIKAKN